jgi:hypothetical protein
MAVVVGKWVQEQKSTSPKTNKSSTVIVTMQMKEGKVVL